MSRAFFLSPREAAQQWAKEYWRSDAIPISHASPSFISQLRVNDVVAGHVGAITAQRVEEITGNPVGFIETEFTPSSRGINTIEDLEALDARLIYLNVTLNTDLTQEIDNDESS